MKNTLFTICLLVFVFGSIKAQKGTTATITGKIIEKNTKKPIEFVTVGLKKIQDSIPLKGSVTDADGKFSLSDVPVGEYKITYSYLGFEKVVTPIIKVSQESKSINLGDLYLVNLTQNLDEAVVTGEKSTYTNLIDRKVFNVGKDLIGKTGTVSDLLQNIPSINVDIDGNVSLRGSESVMILINGRPSALMGTNRAAVLQQIPASSIEKIEVITNPSAKYKPDGTSGIINIVLKKDKTLGWNGRIIGNIGNDSRLNGSIMANYNPGKINLFASYSIRRDNRVRYTSDSRILRDTNSLKYVYIVNNEFGKPLSQIATAGFDYKFNSQNTLGMSGNFDYRTITKTGNTLNVYKNEKGDITDEFNRFRFDPEYDKDMEFTADFKHKFEKEGHELNFDFTNSYSYNHGDNHYSNIYKIPAKNSTYDNNLTHQGDEETQFSVEYTNPVSENIQFESGYSFESSKNDMDYYGELFASNTWEKDKERTNHFIYTQNIHTIYTTYEQKIKNWGVLAGLRAEQTNVEGNQVTTDTIIKNQYFRLYPTLHLSYKITEANELQLSYSHRIHRPDGEDMNPFAEYKDPLNLRVGNPNLKPEDIHSFEFAYQFKKNNYSFLSTLYYRHMYNNITNIVNYINDSVLVMTTKNLSSYNSAGLEIIFSTSLGKFLNVNLSTNTFYSTVDATNLGYSGKKNTYAWSASLYTSLYLSKSTLLQITSKYTAPVLSPQGKILPTFVLNTGFKQGFMKKKAAFIFTISDVFNSLRSNYEVDTRDLYVKYSKKRSARIIYAGLSYTFGSANKKQKDNGIKFDNQL